MNKNLILEYDNYSVLKPDEYNFDNLFDKLIDFCLEYNYSKSGKNYSSSKCFIHIKGGASIKYKMKKSGLPNNKITDDIDIILVPFENNPEIRIKLVEEFMDELKKKFNNFSCSYEFDNKLFQIYMNYVKIFDIVFYDNVRPFYKDFNCSIWTNIIKKLKFNSVDEYFIQLKNKFKSDLNNFNTLENVTFTSLEFDKNYLILLLLKYNKELNKTIDKVNFYKNKIIKDSKKLKYINLLLR
jgi:hypothetical protein